ncbi:MAG: SpoIIE family protein phosphatase [Alcaligenes sp.]|nr:SpoIIE family protein phosphatase [Alcaligenes sp.]
MTDKFSEYDILPKETCDTLEALERVTSLLVESADAKDALERIGRVLTDVLHASRWSIMIKTELKTMRISHSKGLPKQVIDSTNVHLGQGIAGRVAERGRGELFANVEYEIGITSGGQYKSSSAICVPMVLRGEVLGIINLSEKLHDHGGATSFNTRDLTLALLTANQAALMFEMLRISEATRGYSLPTVDELQNRDKAVVMQASAFELLSTVTDLMVFSGSLDKVLNAVIQGACHLLNSDRGSLMLLDETCGELRIRAAIGISQDVIAAVCIRPGDGIAGRVLETGEALLVAKAPHMRLGSNAAVDSDARVAQYRNQSALCIPVQIRGKVLGVFNINDRKDMRDFGENDLYIARVIANQAAVAISAASLLIESIATAELQQSLEIAQEIQESLMPAVPEIPGFDLARISDACASAAGDYIDYFPLEGEQGQSSGQYYLACGDVSGHGIGAALIMAMSRAFLRALLWQETQLSTALYKMNNLIEADTPVGQFMTLFVGRLDFQSGVMSYVSAGHEPGLIYQTSTGAITLTETTGIPLGIFGGQSYDERELRLEPDDILLLPTDGIAEAMNIHGEFYGRERLEQDLRELHDRPAAMIMEEIKQRVLAFVDPGLLRDDLSMIVIKRDSHSLQ